MARPPHPQPKSPLTGCVGTRLGVRKLFGWVRCSACADFGKDSAVSLLHRRGVIGSGIASSIRQDVGNPSFHRAWFLMTCDEPLSDATIAFGELVVEARDAAGHFATLPITRTLRNTALMRVLERAPPADPLFAAAILGWLAGSRELPIPVIAQLRASRDALLPPREVPPPSAGPVAKDPAAEAERRFWFRFEKIAGDCTLGMMQRRAGAEPLGLLRFASAPVEAVRSALKNDFQGVGSPEFTRLEPNDDGEYMSRDTRYHMISHTFIYRGEMPFDRLFQQQCRKIAYLARNLLEDITEGDKIFVVFDWHHPPDPAKVRLLHAALRERGPGWLVHVRSIEAGNSAIGTAVREDDGLINAYVGPMETTTPAERLVMWRAACGAAAAIVDASRSPVQVAAE